ncbi:MAG: hypothetical protein WCC90_18570 [Methylocella sp.]
MSQVHSQRERYAQQGRLIALTGHAGHPEVEGPMGRMESLIHSQRGSVSCFVLCSSGKLIFFSLQSKSPLHSGVILHL